VQLPRSLLTHEGVQAIASTRAADYDLRYKRYSNHAMPVAPTASLSGHMIQTLRPQTSLFSTPCQWACFRVTPDVGSTATTTIFPSRFPSAPQQTYSPQLTLAAPPSARLCLHITYMHHSQWQRNGRTSMPTAQLAQREVFFISNRVVRSFIHHPTIVSHKLNHTRISNIICSVVVTAASTGAAPPSYYSRSLQGIAL